MAHIEASWIVRETNSGTFELPQDADNIGYRDVMKEIRAAYPFDDIDDDSLDWDVIDDGSD